VTILGHGETQASTISELRYGSTVSWTAVGRPTTGTNVCHVWLRAYGQGRPTAISFMCRWLLLPRSTILHLLHVSSHMLRSPGNVGRATAYFNDMCGPGGACSACVCVFVWVCSVCVWVCSVCVCAFLWVLSVCGRVCMAGFGGRCRQGQAGCRGAGSDVALPRSCQQLCAHVQRERERECVACMRQQRRFVRSLPCDFPLPMTLA